MLLQELQEVFGADSVVHHLAQSKAHRRIGRRNPLQLLNGRPGIVLLEFNDSGVELMRELPQDILGRMPAPEFNVGKEGRRHLDSLGKFPDGQVLLLAQFSNVLAQRFYHFV